MRVYSCLLAAGMLTAGACADTSAPTTAQGDTPLNLNIAALTLSGVQDAVWDIRVDNASDQTVFSTRIKSSQYGDSKGSASYVGTCDAQTGGTQDGNGVFTATNKVYVDIIGIYASAVTYDATADEGAGDEDYGDVAPAGALPFQDPGTLEQDVDCTENADAFVKFDVALMRPANQGFFDIAVNFNDIFCSAKFDCDTNPLLHDSASVRGTTYVLGFACSAGEGATTVLHMDDLELTCDGTTYTLDPTSADGNACTAGTISSNTSAQNCGLADGPFYQAAIYQGTEQNSNIKYWNIALGVLPAAYATDGTGCTLTTKATADDSSAAAMTGNSIAANQVYPYINFDVDFGVTDGCGTNPMSYTEGDSVLVTYTSTTGAQLDFDH